MKRFFAILILSVASVTLAAQCDWDGVLDRYESICGKCVELRSRMSSGEPVPGRAVAGLLEEMGRLRSQLKWATGSMTAAQRQRFDSIRERYEGKTDPPTPKAVPKVKPRPSAEAPLPKMAFHPPEKPVEVQRIQPLACIAALDSPAKALSGGPAVGLVRQEAPSRLPGTSPEPWAVDVAAGVQLGAMPAADLFVAASRGQWGAFMSVKSNFRSVPVRYLVSSDGKIPGGGLFWGNSFSDYSFTGISIGPVWRPLPFLSLYAEAGYAHSCLAWQDIFGAWAQVEDCSCRGLAGEAGLLFTLGRFDLLTGVWLQQEAAVTFGLGWRF